jgi:hypothetical protein
MDDISETRGPAATSEAAAPVAPEQGRRWLGLIPVAVAVCGAAFGALIVLAIQRGDFAAEFEAITAMPWGQVTLADLYLGFLLYALVVLAIERSWPVRLFWALPVFVLGNVWAAAWVAVRWRVIVARLLPGRQN